MNVHPGLEDLQRQWQAQPAREADLGALRRRVASDNRAHLRGILILLVLNLMLLAGTLWRALATDSPDSWFGFTFAVIFSAVAWCVGLYLVRGQRAPRDESIAAYLDVSIRRSRAWILAAPVGTALYLAGLVSSLVLRQRLLGLEWSELLGSVPVIISGWVGAPLYAGVLFGYAGVHRRRLRWLQGLQQQLSQA